VRLKRLLPLSVLAVLFGLPIWAADITVTATSVKLSSGTSSLYNAGAAVTAGQVVYLHTDGLVYLSDANASATTKAITGIALNGAAIGQPVSVQTSGTITIGATVAVGTIYVVSATAGGIAPSTDLASTWGTIIIGVADTTGTIKLQFFDSGVDVP
jgi:hypothetical protein